MLKPENNYGFKVLQAVEAADQMQEEDQEQEVTRSILEEFGLS